ILRPLRYNQRRLNSVLTQTQPVTARSNCRLVRTALVVAAIGALWFLLCRELSGEWLVNEQYNYGWFVPFFALYLFWLRWQDRPPPEIPKLVLSDSRMDSKSQARHNWIAAFIGITALFLLLPVRLFEIASPEWRMVAHVAAETAMLLGIPARVEGSLIRVSTGLVGVNEACSGIRSLQTSLMIGLLFGELKRLSVLRRVALVVGAVIIAVFANFVRAVFLVGIAATQNISEVGRWHGMAGYTIV